ncbi:hypothetical protein HX864_20410 [Pseudomonas yamanorum]|uniref:hypothetical protein n=1 Tax=Pseudomonas yamanorum TaxID=515393 RepID=UPI0015A36D62|nr:hypothetical protein [Pseudomonas yamanorum]NWD25650.1 hypothetical protein [Pseudomonas yamanorum]
MKYSEASLTTMPGDTVPGVSRRKVLLASVVGAVAIVGALLANAAVPSSINTSKL